MLKILLHFRKISSGINKALIKMHPTDTNRAFAFLYLQNGTRKGELRVSNSEDSQVYNNYFGCKNCSKFHNSRCASQFSLEAMK